MKKKIVKSIAIPEFDKSIEEMPEDSKIFVDKSLEIAGYIFQLLEDRGWKQKDLADKLDKTEAEVSKWLAGMHNYTLRSIAKMEAALGESIICTPKSFSQHKTLSSSFWKKKVNIESGQLQSPPSLKVTYGKFSFKSHVNGKKNITTEAA